MEMENGINELSEMSKWTRIQCKNAMWKNLPLLV